MSEQTTVECPADGCDYTGLFNSVCAHHAGKRDDAHSGGYEYARTQLENEGHSPDDSKPSEQQPDSPDTDTSGNPAMGGPTVEQSSDGPHDDETDTPDDTPTTPCCGEPIPVEEIPAGGAVVTCECGKQYEVNP